MFARRKGLALTLALALSTTHAHAEPPLSTEMQTYFDGEKSEGYAWFTLGAAGLTGGAALLQQNCNNCRGAGWPLIGFGALQFIAGLWLLGVTDARVADLRLHLDKEGAPVRDRELLRMRGVERSFVILKWVEAALLAAGASTAVVAFATHESVVGWLGGAIGVESAVMLLLDGLAARRASRYARALSGFHVATISNGALVGFSGSF